MPYRLIHILILSLLGQTLTGCALLIRLDKSSVVVERFENADQILLGPDGSIAIRVEGVYWRQLADGGEKEVHRAVRFLIGEPIEVEALVRQKLRGQPQARPDLDRLDFRGVPVRKDHPFPWRIVPRRFSARSARPRSLPRKLRREGRPILGDETIPYKIAGATVMLDFSEFASEEAADSLRPGAPTRTSYFRPRQRRRWWWYPVIGPTAAVDLVLLPVYLIYAVLQYLGIFRIG